MYTHKTDKGEYDLWKREVELKGGGRVQTIYYFTKHGNKAKSGAPCDLPADKKVGVNKVTGLPHLKNI